MEQTSSIFSFVFLLAALIPIFWGFHIIKLNKKSSINRAFLLLCISLSIWSFGFSMANLSQNLENALIWRRFSALGWTLIFSVIVHFLLLVSNQKDDIKHSKYLFLIYIPALINMYIFALSNNMAIVQYNLVRTDYGWTNLAVNNGWDYFYYAYYSLYMIASLVITWKWKSKIKEEKKMRQANLIFLAILSSVLLASLTDIAASSILSRPLPQMAPLFVLLPVWSLYYSARHYHLVDYEKKDLKETDELIITVKEKDNIYNNISKAIFINGGIIFLVRYIIDFNNISSNLRVGIIESLTFIFIGIVIRLVQKLKNNRLKEQITMAILIASIPIFMIYFLDSITIWAYPLIIIIASLVFSKKTLLLSAGIVSILTQILIWMTTPYKTVVMDQNDYIFRIIILASAIIVGYYVNKTYIAKMKENDFRIKFQELNASISSDFISINAENADEKINQFLARVGSFFKSDRVYIFMVDYEDYNMTYSHEWCNEGIESGLEKIGALPLKDFRWWIRELEDKRFIHVKNTGEMPEEASNEQRIILEQNIKSLVSVPVQGKDRIKAIITIDSVNSYREWPEEDVDLLHILSNLLSDALARMNSEEEIQHMAYYDNLTNLPNRFLFKDRVVNAINLAKRTGGLISIIFIDLDNFKSVNDTIGHDGGDQLLKEVARNLKSRVRKSDTVSRFGGDEYMIMLNNIKDEEDISRIADKVLSIFAKPFIIQGQEFFVTGSLGISVYPIDGEDPKTLIKNADTAMYQAKSKGKNRYAFCTSSMKTEVEKNLTISNDLFYALDRNQFSVHYQPQMDLSNKHITGLEALLRWEHPKLGMIPPKVFIPIAEKNGSINNIGDWVLRTACLQNKKWQDMGLSNFKIGVNLSAIQFRNPNISYQIERILNETGLDPKYLELEITESIAIKEADFVVRALNKLKEIGVSIAIDDFGTEYSSLSRLKNLPIDRIKIDMEFIHGIENNEKDKAITTIIINLAKSLGLNVLAEGVETAPQVEFLNQKMCEYVQGYYYHKPMPADRMEKILIDLQDNII